jgi:hypothetical protein
VETTDRAIAIRTTTSIGTVRRAGMAAVIALGFVGVHGVIAARPLHCRNDCRQDLSLARAEQPRAHAAFTL